MLSKVISRILITTLVLATLFLALGVNQVGQASSAGGIPADYQNPYYWLAKAGRAYNTAHAPTQANMQASMEVIASGLNNPRGLAFGADGALYVAESGVGGTELCIPGPEGGDVCYGATGSITRVKDGAQQRFSEGFPSLADPSSGGFAATGPSDVSPRLLGLDVITGLGADPAARELLGSAGEGFGQMIRVAKSGSWIYYADVSAYERAQNPDGGEFDSNPYSLALVQRGMRSVADAGANALLDVYVNGRIETAAVFPERMAEAPPFLGLPPGTLIPMQSVPDAVVVGPDGALYVGELTGFPFPVGGANVYRVEAGAQPEVFAEGFTNIIDIAFDKDGNLYVLEITHNGLLSDDLTGALYKVALDGTRSMLAMDGLVAPGGLVIGEDGGVYVSNFSIFPGAGQVIRITDAAPSGPLPLQLDEPDALDALSYIYTPMLMR